MSRRITEADLDRLIGHVNYVLPGRDYSLDIAYGGYRLVSHAGSIDVSGRYSKRELHVWIHAFLDGVYESRKEC